MKKLIFTISMLFFSGLQLMAADYFWVGGTGNWNATNRWATTSGGSTFYATPPTSVDNVYFDANSFTAAGQIVTINVNAVCADMNWTGATNSPQLTGTFTLSVYGSLTLISAMNFNVLGTVYFESLNTGKTLTSAGQSFKRNVYFQGVGGYVLEDDFLQVGSYTVYLVRGTLDLNEKNMTANAFDTYNTNVRSLFLTSSTVTLTTTGTAFQFRGENLTLNAGTSLIRLTGAGGNFMQTNSYGPGQAFNNVTFEAATGNSTLASAGGSFNNVTFNSTATLSISGGSTYASIIAVGNVTVGTNGNNIANLQVGGNLTMNNNSTYGDITLAGNATVNASNVIGNLTMAPGKYLTLASGQTQTFTGSLSANGTCTSRITIQSSSTTQANISKSGGFIAVNYCYLQGINGTGGASFTAANTIDLGNNSGWLIIPPSMQNLYWVGGSGNWNDPAHWSTSSGGPSGACIPSALDNVFFDVNSFGASGQTVTVAGDANEQAYCRSMNWAGALNNPTVAGASTVNLNIYGSLTLIPGMTYNVSSPLYFKATVPGNNIFTAGKALDKAAIYFDGVGGEWTLQDALSMGTRTLYLVGGTLNTNNQAINASVFNSYANTKTRALNLGSSQITLTGSGTAFYFRSENFSLNAGTSHIRITYAGADLNHNNSNGPGVVFNDVTFEAVTSTSTLTGYGCTFNNVIFNSSGSVTGGNAINNLSFAVNGTINSNGNNINTLVVGGTATINNTGNYGHVTMNGNGSITANNAFGTLIFSAGKQYTITSTRIITINDDLIANGTDSQIIVIKSSTVNSQATISKSSGTVEVNYVSLQDNNATGGATFIANNSIDLGNNTGWTIYTTPKEFYWVGGTGNYNDPAKWSLTSGGTGGAGVPTAIDNAYFDANSFSAPGQVVTIIGDASSNARAKNMNWTGVNYNPTIAGASTQNLRVHGSLILVPGITCSFAGNIYFEATETGQAVTTAGISLGTISNMYFQGDGGGWTLTNALNIGTKTLYLVRGSLNTNSQNITAGIFNSNYSGNTRSLTLGSSEIILSSTSNQALKFHPTGMTFNAGTSLIRLTGAGAGIENLSGSGLFFYDVVLEAVTGTSLVYNSEGGFNTLTFNSHGNLYYTNTINTLTIAGNGTIASNSNNITTVVVGGTTTINGNTNTFGHFTMNGNGTVTQNNTFGTLVLKAAKQYTFTNGKTQTFVNDLIAEGTETELIVIKSSSAGSTTTFSKASGAVEVNYVSLQDNAATGGATFTAYNSVDLGGNSGWTILSSGSKDYYWIGGTGNWNDASEWSLTSGGAGGAGIPTAIDNVFFDGNSFTAPGQVVTVIGDASNNARVVNMDWTGAAFNPTLTGASTQNLRISGSMTLNPAMSVTFAGPIYLEATETGKLVTTAGVSLGSINNLYFQGEGGGWTLMDGLNLGTKIIYLVRGALSTNNQPISTGMFDSNYSGNVRSLTLGSSEITLSSTSYIALRFHPTGMTFDAGTSLIRFTGSGAGIYNLNGSGLFFNDVIFEATTGTVDLYNNDGGFNTIIFQSIGTSNLRYSNTVNSVTFAGTGGVYDNNTISYAKFNGNGTITGNNTFGTLEFTPGFTYTITNNKTQIITTDLIAHGTCPNPITIQSNSTTVRTTIQKNTGTIAINQVSIQGLNATGGATFIATNAIDLGNNLGWTINPVGIQNLYWVGGTGNWDDVNHWSNASGGAGGYCIPTMLDNVVFDQNSFSQNGQAVYVNLANASCRDMDWSVAAFAPTFTTLSNTYKINIYGSLTLNPEMNFAFNGPVHFLGGAPANSSWEITMTGKNFSNEVVFNGEGGIWTLNDNLTISSNDLYLTKGTLNTGDKTVTIRRFISDNNNVRALNSGASVINVGSNQTQAWYVTGSNFTINPGTSEIRFSSANGSMYSIGTSNLTYHNIHFQNPGGISNLRSDDQFNNITFQPAGKVLGGGTFNNVIFYGNGEIENNNSFGDVTFFNNALIQGSNSFSNLTLTPGKLCQMQAGQTQTIINSLNFWGNSDNPISLQSLTPGSQATVSKASGIVSGNYILLKDMFAAGGATFNVYNSTDLGNNDNWNFLEPPFATCPENFSACINATPFVLSQALPAGWDYSGEGVYFDNGVYMFNPSLVNGSQSVVTYTIGGLFPGSCNFTITILPLPVANCRPDIEVCEDSDYITLYEGVGQYYYNNQPITGFNPTDPGTFPIIFEVTNSCGSANCTFNIIVKPLPQVSITGDLEICQGESTILTATAGASYLWSTNETTRSIEVNVAGIYSVEVTDANGCKNTVQVTVIVHPVPFVEIGGDLEICQGESSILTATAGASYLWSTNETTRSIEVNVAGIYSVEVTDANGCKNTAQVTLIVHPLPVVEISGDLEICQGESTILTATAGASYLWSTNETTRSIQVSAAGIYSVEVTDANGCKNTAQVTLIVHPVPVVEISGDLEICQGESTILTATAGASYLWSTNETTRSIQVSAAGIYSVEVTDANGCKNTAQVTLIVHPLPVVEISGDLEICQGESTILTSTAGASYLWSTNETTRSIEVNVAGIYSVEVTDANGCKNTTQVPVIVHPVPFVEIGGDLEICQGESSILTATAGISYLWSTNETTRSIEVNVAGIYSVEVTDANGCKNTVQVTVIVHPVPFVEIGGDLEFCQGESTILTATAGASYLWSTNETTRSIQVSAAGIYSIEVTDANGCKNTAQVTLIVHPLPSIEINGQRVFCEGQSTILTATEGSTYDWSSGESTRSITITLAGTYSVTVTDAHGCQGYAEATASYLPVIIPTCPENMFVLVTDSPFVLTGGLPAGGTYSGAGVTSGIFDPSVGVGNYPVTYTIQDVCGPQSCEFIIHVSEEPITCQDATITNFPTNAANACQNDAYTIDFTGVVITNAVETIWSVTPVEAGVVVGNLFTLAQGYTGGVNISLLAVAEAPCNNASVSIAFIVNPLPTFTYELSDNEVCAGESVTFTNHFTGTAPWTVEFLDNGVPNSFTTSQNPEYYTQVMTQNMVYEPVSVTDGKGCTSAVNQPSTILVNPLPTFTYVLSDTEVCAGESVTFTNHFTGTAPWTVEFLDNGVPNSFTTSENPQYYTQVMAQNMVYEPVSVTDGKGCTSAVNQPSTILVNPLPTFTSELSATEVCIGEAVNFVNYFTGTAPWTVIYKYNGVQDFFTTSNNPDYYSEIFTETTINEIISVTDGNGCTKQYSNNITTITVNPLPVVEINGDLEICQGESTILTATAGASYLWSTNETTRSIQVSAAGIYSVEVTDANGCKNTAQVTVIVHPLPVVEISGDLEICQGESSILTATAGASYQWSTNETTRSIEVNVAGIYSVEVTDANGCKNTAQVTVIVHPLPVVEINGDLEICQGESTILTATAGASYLWSTNETTRSIQVSVAGIYSVEVTDANGCKNTVQVTVIVHPVPVIEISGNRQFCEGQSTILTATEGSTYDWSSGESTRSITITLAGTYSVTVTDAHGCQGYAEATTSYLPVTIPTCPENMFVLVTDSPFALTGGVPAGGTYTGAGVTSGIFDPSVGVGNYPVTYTIQDVCGPQSCEFTIHVSEEPITCQDATITNFPTNAANACQNDAYTIDFTGVVITNAVETIWSVTPVEAGVVVGNLFTLAQGYTGGVNISLLAVAEAPCNNASVSIGFNVNPLPVFDCPEYGPYCKGEAPIALTGEGTYTLGGIPVTEFIPTTAGTFVLIYEVTNPQGCSVQCSFEIFVKDVPVTTCPADFSLCADAAPVTLTGATPVGGVYAGTGVSNGVFNPAVAGEGTHSITYTYTENRITTWDFEASNLTPVYGSGTAALYGGTTATFAGGNGSTAAWNTTNYPAQSTGSGTRGVQFSINTNGYQDIIVSWEQRHSNTSANRIRLQYTTNGTTWVNFEASSSNATNTRNNNDIGFDAGRYVANAGDAWFIRSASLSSIAEADNNPLFAIRIVSEFVTTTYGPSNTGSTYNATGTWRFDNVRFTGTPDFPCPAFCNFTIEVKPLPQIIITPSGPTAFCQGEVVELTATEGAAYHWNTGATTQSIEVSTTGLYSVEGTATNGCKGIAQIEVTVHPLPMIQISGELAFCQGQSTTLTATAGISYLWNTGEVSQSIAVTTSGNYSVTVTDVNGCQGDAQVTTLYLQVTIPTCPEDLIVQENDEPMELIGGLPSGGTYSGPGVTNNIFDPSIGEGTYLITYQIDDVCGSQYCQFNITVTGEPILCENASISNFPASASDVCQDEPYTIDFNGVIITNAIQVIWTVAPPSAGNIENNIFTLNTGYLGNVNIGLLAVAQSPCDNAQANLGFSVNPLPVFDCPEYGPYCKGDAPVALTGEGTYTLGGIPVTEFIPSTAGTFVLIYEVTNPQGCSAQCTFEIFVKDVPVTTCPADFSLCADAAPVTLTGATPVGGIYAGTGVSNGVFNPAVAGEGTHSITYTYTENRITTWDFEASNLTPVYGSGTASLYGGTTATFAGGNGSTAAWNTTNYPAQSTGSGTRGVQFSINTNGYQDIIVSWEQRHSNTSANRIRLQYTTDGTTWVNFEASASNATNTRNNNDIGFDAGRYVANAGDAWFIRSANLGSIAEADNNPLFAIRIVSEFVATTYGPSNTGSTYNATGTWRFDNVRFTGTPVFPCPAICTFNIEVKPLPTFYYEISETEICLGEPVTYTNHFTGIAPWTVQFKYNGVLSSFTTYDNPEYFTEILTETTLYEPISVTDGSGCSSEVNQISTVAVHPLPTFYYEISATEVCFGEPVTKINHFTGAAPWTVDFYSNGVLSSFTTYDNPEYFTQILSETSTYDPILITDGNGCSSAVNQATTITVNPLPTFYYEISDTEICLGEPVTYTNHFTGIAPWTVQFKYNGVLSSFTTYDNPEYFTEILTETTLYEPISVTDGSGCTSDINQISTVTVHPLPTFYYEISATEVCLGEPITKINHFTGTAPWTVDFYSNGVLSSFTTYDNPEYFTQILSETTTYDPILVTDGNGCSSAVNQVTTITVNPLPTFYYEISDTEVCLGEPVTYTNHFTGIAPWTVQFKYNGVLSSFTTYDNPEYFTEILTETTLYEPISVTDGSGCSSDVNQAITITVNPLPTFTSEISATEICAGETVYFVDHFTGEAPWTIVFVNNGVQSSFTTSQNPFYYSRTFSETTYNELISITDGKGCTALLNMKTTFIVKPLPLLNCPSFLQAFVTDAPVLLDAVTPAGGVYSGTGVTFNGTNYYFDPAIGTGTYDVTYCYTDPTGGCENCCTFNFIVNASPGDQQIICMPDGWSGISSYFQPAAPLSELFANLVAQNKVTIMVNEDGIYWPGQNVNTLVNWNVYKGYKIKMNGPGCFTITGTQPENKTITMKKGAGFMPVLCESPVPAVDIFQQFGSDLLFAYDFFTQKIYWPQGNIFTLQTLEPGVGYLVSMINQHQATFNCAKSGETSYLKARPPVYENAPWTFTKSGFVHLISVARPVLEQMEPGDYLGVFNAEGLCSGFAQYDGNADNLLLVAYGDDFTSKNNDGLSDGETMNFRIYRSTIMNEQQVEVTFDASMPNSGTFTDAGQSKISGIISGGSPLTNDKLRLISLYPNPSKGFVNLTIPPMEEKINFEVTNATGQLILSTTLEPGTLSYQLNLTKTNPGIYFIRISSGYESVVKRIVIQ